MKQIAFKGGLVTRGDILRAMREFDRSYPDRNLYDRWLEKANYKYAVSEGGKHYPPKHILSQSTGVGIREFSGGYETNTIFRQLGFEIIDKPMGE